MKRFALLLVGVACLAGATPAFAAKKEREKDHDTAASAKPDFVGSYGDWKVYRSGDGKAQICYLLAEPKARDPDDPKPEKAYAFISERPAERVRNELSFVMGFEVANAADVKDHKKERKARKSDDDSAVSPIATVGEDDFDLVPKGSDLWVKNPAEESRVVDEMRKGATLVVKAVSRKGRPATHTYSLSGFSQAIDKALKDCPAG